MIEDDCLAPRLRPAGAGAGACAEVSYDLDAARSRSSWPTAPPITALEIQWELLDQARKYAEDARPRGIGRRDGRRRGARSAGRRSSPRSRPTRCARRPARLGGQVPADRGLPRAPRPRVERPPARRHGPAVPRPAARASRWPPGCRPRAAHRRRRGRPGRHEPADDTRAYFRGRCLPALGRTTSWPPTGTRWCSTSARSPAAGADDGTDAWNRRPTSVRCWTNAPPRPSCSPGWAPDRRVETGADQWLNESRSASAPPPAADEEVVEAPATSRDGREDQGRDRRPPRRDRRRARDQRRGLRAVLRPEGRRVAARRHAPSLDAATPLDEPPPLPSAGGSGSSAVLALGPGLPAVPSPRPVTPASRAVRPARRPSPPDANGLRAARGLHVAGGGDDRRARAGHRLRVARRSPTAAPRSPPTTAAGSTCPTARSPAPAGVGRDRASTPTATIVDAYRILTGHRPELRRRADAVGHVAVVRGDRPAGQVWECDPTGRRRPPSRPAIGTLRPRGGGRRPRRRHAVPHRGRRPTAASTASRPTTYPDLTAGTLEVGPRWTARRRRDRGSRRRREPPRRTRDQVADEHGLQRRRGRLVRQRPRLLHDQGRQPGVGLDRWPTHAARSSTTPGDVADPPLTGVDNVIGVARPATCSWPRTAATWRSSSSAGGRVVAVPARRDEGAHGRRLRDHRPRVQPRRHARSTSARSAAGGPGPASPTR